MFKNNHICVVIPSYNSVDTLPAVIQSIPGWVDFIVVVDDCSQDETWQMASEFKSGKVLFIHNEFNRGVGGAMKVGYQKAMAMGMDIIIKMDSDGQMDASYLPALINPIVCRKADYTKGNRFIHIKQLRLMPWVRQCGNMALSFLTKLASGYWNIFDPTNGYTAIYCEALKLLDFDNLSDRYFFESSMLIELYLNRVVVKDISIPALYKGNKSNLSELKSIWEFSLKLCRGFFLRIWKMYFLVDFSAASVFLISGALSCIFSLVWGVYHWIISIQTNVAATSGTVMIAVIPAMMGFQMLLQSIILDIQNVPQEVIKDLKMWEEKD